MKLLTMSDVNGNGTVFVRSHQLPDALMARLGVGDVLKVREAAAGIELLPCGGEFEAQIVVAEEVMAENYELLSKLAK